MVSQPTAKPRLPGRLGDPGMALRDDPRADPRMLAAMAPYGLANPQPPPPVDRNSSLEELRAFCSEAEVAYDAVNDAFTHGLPPVGGVSSATLTIRGMDGNHITLYVARPTDAQSPLLRERTRSAARRGARVFPEAPRRRRQRLEPYDQRDESRPGHGHARRHARGLPGDRSRHQGVRGLGLRPRVTRCLADCRLDIAAARGALHHSTRTRTLREIRNTDRRTWSLPGSLLADRRRFRNGFGNGQTCSRET